MRKLTGLTAAIFFLHSPGFAQHAADGKTLFKQRCSVCHQTESGAAGIGPALSGVLGRKAGVAPGYSYSAALRGADMIWTAQRLNAFLTAPAKLVPGTKMPVSVPSPAEREAIVAYLATLK